MTEPEFLTPTKFSLRVEEVSAEKAIPLLEAVLLLCEEIGKEPEEMPRLLTPSLKSKIEVEARAKNLIVKGGEALPI